MRKVKMTLFASRGVKSHEWTFYDPIIDNEDASPIMVADAI